MGTHSEPKTKSPPQKVDEKDFTVTISRWGTTRSYQYPEGSRFSEFTSHSRILGFPLMHRTRGKNPHTGRPMVAKGVIAIGRVAFGVVACGQLAFGLLAIGQVAVGTLFCLGQAAMGFTAVGQLAVGGLFGFGQIATGAFSVGQIAVGWVALGQFALAIHGIDMRGIDPQALAWWNWLLP